MTWIGNEPVQRRARILSEGVTDAATSSIQIAGGYTVGNIAVFINGSRLPTDQFDDSDGYVITFVNELPSGTEWTVEDIQAFEAQTFTSEAVGGSNVKRDANGTFKVSEATDPAHPATKAELDSVEAQLLSVGQTWQTVTDSRAFNVTYTNNTDRPIVVGVYMNAHNSTASIDVNGERGAYIAGSDTAIYVCTIVPASGTYRVLAVSSAVLFGWVELR